MFLDTLRSVWSLPCLLRLILVSIALSAIIPATLKTHTFLHRRAEHDGLTLKARVELGMKQFFEGRRPPPWVCPGIANELIARVRGGDEVCELVPESAQSYSVEHEVKLPRCFARNMSTPSYLQPGVVNCTKFEHCSWELSNSCQEGESTQARKHRCVDPSPRYSALESLPLITFVGTSHARYLFQTLCLYAVMNGKEESTLSEKKQKYVCGLDGKHGRKAFRFQNLQMIANTLGLSQEYSIKILRSKLEFSKQIVYTRGAWDMIYNNTTPWDYYASVVRDIRDIYNVIPPDAVLYVYVPHYHHPPTEDKYKPCVTLQRQIMYKSVFLTAVNAATKEARRYARYIDFFDETQHMSVYTDGWGHHYNSTAMHWMARRVIHELSYPRASLRNKCGLYVPKSRLLTPVFEDEYDPHLVGCACKRYQWRGSRNETVLRLCPHTVDVRKKKGQTTMPPRAMTIIKPRR